MCRGVIFLPSPHSPLNTAGIKSNRLRDASKCAEHPLQHQGLRKGHSRKHTATAGKVRRAQKPPKRRSCPRACPTQRSWANDALLSSLVTGAVCCFWPHLVCTIMYLCKVASGRTPDAAMVNKVQDVLALHLCSHRTCYLTQTKHYTNPMTSAGTHEYVDHDDISTFCMGDRASGICNCS